MLTTASSSGAATSATDSGPRAAAGIASATAAIPAAKIAVARHNPNDKPDHGPYLLNAPSVACCARGAGTSVPVNHA